MMVLNVSFVFEISKYLADRLYEIWVYRPFLFNFLPFVSVVNV